MSKCQKNKSHGLKLLALLKYQLHQTASLKSLHYRQAKRSYFYKPDFFAILTKLKNIENAGKFKSVLTYTTLGYTAKPN